MIRAAAGVENPRAISHTAMTTSLSASGAIASPPSGPCTANAQTVPASQLTAPRTPHFREMAALTGLATMQELGNELRAAAATYEEALRQAANLQYPVISEAYLGLARITYEWNDLPRAKELAAKSLDLGRRLQHTDRPAASQVQLGRVALAAGNFEEVEQILAAAEREVGEGGFEREAPNVVAARVRLLLARGESEAAERAVHGLDLPLAVARVRLAHGDAAEALAVLAPFRRRAEERGWADDRLRALVLEALARHAAGEAHLAEAALDAAVAIAQPEGFVRLFLDEGAPMARLLREVAADRHPVYARLLLTAFRAEAQRGLPGVSPTAVEGLIDGLVESLTGREAELLSLIADGLTNAQIAERLFLSPHTVKVHVRNIFAKLEVGSRTQAVAKARGAGILQG